MKTIFTVLATLVAVSSAQARTSYFSCTTPSDARVGVLEVTDPVLFGKPKVSFYPWGKENENPTGFTSKVSDLVESDDANLKDFKMLKDFSTIILITDDTRIYFDSALFNGGRRGTVVYRSNESNLLEHTGTSESTYDCVEQD